MVINDKEEVCLKNLFPSKKEVYSKLINNILDGEKYCLARGRLKKPYTDKELLDILNRLYGINISRRTLCEWRRHRHINNSYKRDHETEYSLITMFFSKVYLLNFTSIKKHIPEGEGVYELSIRGSNISYNKGSSRVFYIGSARNLKKRLTDHLRPNGKNAKIKFKLNKYKCLFRYKIYPKDWRLEEKKAISSFIGTFGSLPKCNSIRA